MPKLLVIGLDCCAPELLFDNWRDDLPNLNSIMEQGIYGELTSTIPPITVPAWTCMLSSKDPGQLGFYGFRNRKSYDYEELYFANASYVKERRVLEYLEEGALRSILIGIPQTYPVKPVAGILVGCFLTPSKAADYTYPSTVKEEIDRIAGGEYIIDVKDFRTDNKDWLLKQIYLMTERRFRVVRHYLKREDWDFCMFVEMGTDRIHHGFWRFMDTRHRLYQPGSPYENAIKEYYQYVDREIGELLRELDSDTSIMVVSDHGAKSMEGAICVNEWLIQRGYLTLKTPVDKTTKLTADMIEWKATRAWAEGGYYSRVFLNVEGREPQGIIPVGEYENFRNELKREIEDLGDEAGLDIGTKVYKPQEVYRSVMNIPPDLIVYFGDLGWRAAGTVGTGRIHIYENDTGPDDSNHSDKGVFILKTDVQRIENAGYEPNQRIENLIIYDVAPTILDLFGIPIPSDMIGRSVLKGEVERRVDAESQTPFHIQESQYSSDEEEIIKQRLEDLGYL